MDKLEMIAGKDQLTYGSNGTVSTLYMKGKNLLYPPKRNDLGQLRGGIPICVPFGKNAELFGWPSHGILRNTDMVPRLSQGSKVFLTSSDAKLFGKYNEMPFEMNAIYTYGFLNTSTFGMSVAIEQHNEKGKSIPSNMCFHPYFLTPNDSREPSKTIEVKAGDTSFQIRDMQLGDCKKGKMLPMPKDGKVEIIIPSQGTIIMTAPKFGALNIWRDSLDFICIEPVETFPELFNTEKGSFMNPDREIKLSMFLEFIEE